MLSTTSLVRNLRHLLPPTSILSPSSSLRPIPQRRRQSSPLLFDVTRRYFSKYLSKSATKRLPLTTKRAGKGYKKGKGCTNEGRLTSKGKFIRNWSKSLQLVVPDLEGFKLKPYIASSVSKCPPEDRRALGASKSS
mmetsp:Transcript_26870/g.32558  ORF Transcript_26870/g.32558 Transcript_26870/m.32558 type:complete len:136 (+) Transcript_26870:150-557(+)